MATTQLPRQRIRTLIPTLHLGRFSPGPKNSLTDVPGVLVSTHSIRKPASSTHGKINTGLTTILPRRRLWDVACHAGIFSFNGAGEMTGAHWMQETGLLSMPVLITSTFGIGAAYEGAQRHFCKTKGMEKWFTLPVVAETYDGRLTDVSAFPLRPEHVVQGIDDATDASVEEGCTGGGTGMVCHGFKAGTGSSSRQLPVPNNYSNDEARSHFVLGALVQANYGAIHALRVGGVPVGKIFAEEKEKAKQKVETVPKKDGSIIIVLATDMPLSSLQLQRLAKRATVGLARVGGVGNNYSGDIFLAFSTAAEVQLFGETKKDLGAKENVLDEDMNDLFEAAADVVEEAIYNALCMAETMAGLEETFEAIDLKKLKELVEPRIL